MHVPYTSRVDAGEGPMTRTAASPSAFGSAFTSAFASAFASTFGSASEIFFARSLAAKKESDAHRAAIQ